MKFVLVDKRETDVFLSELFKILHSNMSMIAPTNNSYDTDFKTWSSNIIPAMQKQNRQIVLMYVNDTLVGYFQYYINTDTNSLAMEEIQIDKAFQGTGLFSEFYRWLVKQIPDNIENVEAYANKRNFKSQDILVCLGLDKLGENKNGNSFYYKGRYADLLNKYS
ncbi:MAG: hypothetical protein E7591_07890 [Ruminococcaceae bacterium]|nr:hypothetical protein [Oscillospiraceae bacterium]